MWITERLKAIAGSGLRLARAFRVCYRDGGLAVAQIAYLNHGGILKGRRALVTGGSAGIGLAIARKCLSEGALVVITGRDKAKLQRAAAELNSPLLHLLGWDVSDVSCAEAKIQEAEELAGGMIDLLINNAGVLVAQDFLAVNEAAWEKIYATNSKGLFFLSQAMAKAWIARNVKGKILNISSTSAFYGAAHPYGMSKWDVVGLTQGLGKMLAPHGIVVNGIAPGRTATAMLGQDPAGNLYDPLTSARRFGLPGEIAELAVFLLSDAANFIVGQTIVCDGGYTLRI